MKRVKAVILGGLVFGCVAYFLGRSHEREETVHQVKQVIQYKDRIITDTVRILNNTILENKQICAEERQKAIDSTMQARDEFWMKKMAAQADDYTDYLSAKNTEIEYQLNQIEQFKQEVEQLKQKVHYRDSVIIQLQRSVVRKDNMIIRMRTTIETIDEIYSRRDSGYQEKMRMLSVQVDSLSNELKGSTQRKRPKFIFWNLSPSKEGHPEKRDTPERKLVSVVENYNDDEKIGLAVIGSLLAILLIPVLYRWRLDFKYGRHRKRSLPR